MTLKDGRSVSHFTRHAPGTPENPMDTEQVNANARLLMAPVLGASNTEAIIQRVNALEALKDVRELRPFLAGAGGGVKTAIRKRAVKKAAKPAKPARKKSVNKKAVKKK